MPKIFLERVKMINHLISTRNTATLGNFAEKLEMSERMLNEYLDTFREQGAPISYDKERNTYCYESNRLCIILFIIKCLRQLR